MRTKYIDNPAYSVHKNVLCHMLEDARADYNTELSICGGVIRSTPELIKYKDIVTAMELELKQRYSMVFDNSETSWRFNISLYNKIFATQEELFQKAALLIKIRMITNVLERKNKVLDIGKVVSVTKRDPINKEVVVLCSMRETHSELYKTYIFPLPNIFEDLDSLITRCNNLDTELELQIQSDKDVVRNKYPDE